MDRAVKFIHRLKIFCFLRYEKLAAREIEINVVIFIYRLFWVDILNRTLVFEFYNRGSNWFSAPIANHCYFLLETNRPVSVIRIDPDPLSVIKFHYKFHVDNETIHFYTKMLFFIHNRSWIRYQVVTYF